MNQIQRDLTYRLDVVQSICKQYGYKSEDCQYSIQIWESQHVMNMFYSQMFLYSKFILLTAGFFILGYILYFRFFKVKTKQKPKE